MPNVFSPNQDNNNDILLHLKANLLNLLRCISTIAGAEKVFETKDINKWWDAHTKDQNLHQMFMVIILELFVMMARNIQKKAALHY